MEKFDQDLEKFDQELENFKSVRKFWNKNFQDMVTKIFFPEFGFSKTFFSKTWFPPVNSLLDPFLDLALETRSSLTFSESTR